MEEKQNLRAGATGYEHIPRGGLTFKPLGLTLLIAVTVWGVVLAVRPSYRGVRAGHVDANYLTSEACLACHADHHASWARTYHSRMTQEARPATVQGDFEHDNSFDYLGVRARMEKRGDTFSMTMRFADGRVQSFPVDRLVGSRRIEQYLTKNENGQYTRLPLAYDLTDHRWISLNGAFFYPDGDNYFQHSADWDLNCVFCHNVKAQPHFAANTRRYEAETEVAELGIACGACHGAAATHAEAATSPLTRTRWRLWSDEPRQIVQPRKLTAERAMMVCGHCHGQRLPEPVDRVEEILIRGDPFNAGDDLGRYFRPISRETTIGPHAMANRFWRNGSPRLTAYEYQGLLRSRCFIAGDAAKRINCLTCHSMHAGDPKGQITEENRGNAPCLSCHPQYRSPQALAQHTGHKAASSGSRCYACHMPRVVYGVMSVHPTHEITNPAPQLTVTHGVPNACNQCHLDESVNWAIRQSKRFWPDTFQLADPSPDRQFELAEGPRALFAGDALTRALAAEAMGGGGGNQIDRQWAASYLVEAFADNYPVVRLFAARGLAADQQHLPRLDYLAPPEVRARALAPWRAAFGEERRDKVVMVARELRASRHDVDIEVGE